MSSVIKNNSSIGNLNILDSDKQTVNFKANGNYKINNVDNTNNSNSNSLNDSLQTSKLHNNNYQINGIVPSPPPSNEEQMICMICEDKATGLHYGIITCEG